MPFQPRHHLFGHGGLRFVGPHPPAAPAPRSDHQYCRPAPPHPHLYNQHGRPLHIHTSLCHAVYPPCLIDDPIAQQRFINEQWYLARPSAPNLASQHQARRVLLNAREQKYGWFTLVGFFLGLVFGAGMVREDVYPPPEPRRPLKDVVWDNVSGLFWCLFDITGKLVAIVYQGVKRIDWNKVWQAAAFLYMVYIWGKPDSEKRTHIVAGRSRASSEASQGNYRGVQYKLVPEARGWCEYSYEPSGEATADKKKQGVSGNFRGYKRREKVGVKQKLDEQTIVVDGQLWKGWKRYGALLRRRERG